jgi:hypothetical protein
VVDDVEARFALGPVHGRDVEEHVEAELVPERSDHVEQLCGLDQQCQHPVRHGGLPDHAGEVLANLFEDRLAHGQNFSLMIGWRSRAIRSCSFMMPSMTISGRGGQPGM